MTFRLCRRATDASRVLPSRASTSRWEDGINHINSQSAMQRNARKRNGTKRTQNATQRTQTNRRERTPPVYAHRRPRMAFGERRLVRSRVVELPESIDPLLLLVRATTGMTRIRSHWLPAPRGGRRSRGAERSAYETRTELPTPTAKRRAASDASS